MAEYTRREYTPEEVAEILGRRKGGRKAGRGDSPYSQEEYERIYGIGKKEDGEDGSGE